MSQAAPVAVLPREMPQNPEAEESVLGAMMVTANAIAAVSELVDAGDFYFEKHGKIFRAAVGLYLEGKPVDPITLVHRLEELGQLAEVGGSVKIAELAHNVPAVSNVAHHARIVREMSVLRSLVTAGREIERSALGHEGPTDELVARAEQVLFDVSQARSPGELVLLKQALVESFERVSHLYETGAEITGVSSGFPDLDRITAGFQPGNLIILAARPAMGKSALGVGMALNAALKDLPCAFFALEMSRSEIAQRVMCAEAKVETHTVRVGKLSAEDWPRLTAACAKLESVPLFVDDTPALTMLDLRSRVQTLKRREPKLGLVVVDYLQLMSVGGQTESRLQEISAISRGLKALARDLDLPVVALSQLSRAVEQRPDKRPVLSDLRESGTIEQDADIVMFLYRDDYYNRESETPGVAELHVAKHRSGPTDTVRLSFLRRYAKFASVTS